MAAQGATASGEIDRLCDTRGCDLQSAIALARRASDADPYFDVKLARWLTQNSEITRSDPATATRVLEILCALGVRARLLPFLVQILRNPHSRVMSKLALIVGRTEVAKNWFDRMLANSDPRVHANLVEALWGVNTPECRALLWRTSRSPHNRTAANAIVGLYLLGEPGASDMLNEMVASASARFRASAAWAMGKIGDTAFQPILAKLMTDSDSAVRRNALRSLVQMRKPAATACPGPAPGLGYH